MGLLKEEEISRSFDNLVSRTQIPVYNLDCKKRWSTLCVWVSMWSQRPINYSETYSQVTRSGWCGVATSTSLGATKTKQLIQHIYTWSSESTLSRNTSKSSASVGQTFQSHPHLLFWVIRIFIWMWNTSSYDNATQHSSPVWQLLSCCLILSLTCASHCAHQISCLRLK